MRVAASRTFERSVDCTLSDSSGGGGGQSVDGFCREHAIQSQLQSPGQGRETERERTWMNPYGGITSVAKF